MPDDLNTMLKTIARWEKQHGGNHQMRHFFGALREARYAGSRLQSNENWESPGRDAAKDASAKVHVPEAEDSRNPTVPAEGSPDATATQGSTAEV